MKRFILYILFTFLSVFIFLYVLFPKEEITRYVRTKLNSGDADLGFEINEIKPGFPFKVIIDSPVVVKDDSVLVKGVSISLSPFPLSLVKPLKEVGYLYTLQNGRIKGKVSFPYPMNPEGPMNLTAGFHNITTQDIALLETLSQKRFTNFGLTIRPSSGALNGSIRFEKTPEKQTGDANLVLTDLGLELNASVLPLGEFNFSRVTGEAVLDNQTVNVKGFTFQGDQLNGKVSGTIQLDHPVENSRLELEGQITPHASFIAKLGKAGGSGLGTMARYLFRPGEGSTGIGFVIQGTIKNPILKPVSGS